MAGLIDRTVGGKVGPRPLRSHLRPGADGRSGVSPPAPGRAPAPRPRCTPDAGRGGLPDSTVGRRIGGQEQPVLGDGGGGVPVLLQQQRAQVEAAGVVAGSQRHRPGQLGPGVGDQRRRAALDRPISYSSQPSWARATSLSGCAVEHLLVELGGLGRAGPRSPVAAAWSSAAGPCCWLRVTDAAGRLAGQPVGGEQGHHQHQGGPQGGDAPAEEEPLAPAPRRGRGRVGRSAPSGPPGLAAVATGSGRRRESTRSATVRAAVGARRSRAASRAVSRRRSAW